MGEEQLADDYRPYLQYQFEESCVFQDFLAGKLLPHGIILQSYTSKKYQLEHGESLNGIEIKLDKQFRKTNNFYLEIDERRGEKAPWVPSLLSKEDNSWLCIYGDYEEIYIFALTTLRRYYERCIHKKAQGDPDHSALFKSTKTSRGLLLPLSWAQHMTIKRIAFAKE